MEAAVHIEILNREVAKAEAEKKRLLEELMKGICKN